MKDLSLHILDIVQNSLSAGASRVSIDIEENLVKNTFLISISDNGRGMTAEQLDKVRDPYFTSRTTRKVGMGIPLFEQTARQAGGHLSIESAAGVGTIVKALMMHDHIDRPTLGDIAGVVSMLAGAYPDADFAYHHGIGAETFSFDTVDIKEVLGDMPVSELAIIKYMKQMIEEGLAELSDASHNEDKSALS